MKIQYGSVFGNYKWQAEAEIPDSLVPTLCALGALQVGQRSPSSAAEKEMAGYDKRPAKFNRKDDIPFNEAGVEILTKHLGSMKVETGRNEKDEPIYAEIAADVVVEQYFGSVADVVMTFERETYARVSTEGRAAEVAKKVGYTGELGDGTKDNAPVAFLRAIKAWSEADRKASLNKM